MDIDIQYIDYLKDKRFSNALDFSSITNDPDSRSPSMVDRITFLENECEGRSVLHLGCCDHLELIEQKRKGGRWLHERLTSSAKHCLGLDININAIEYIKSELRMSNVVFGDIMRSLPEEVENGNPWEKVVAGELIEHIGNPVTFLKNIHNNLAEISEELVVTVPNAFSLENYFNAKKGVETINSDHRFWFTPYTISKILSDSGFTPISLHFTTSSPVYTPSAHSFLRFKFYRPLVAFWKYHRLLHNPMLRDTIIVISKF